jgi:hypothetical protein
MTTAALSPRSSREKGQYLPALIVEPEHVRSPVETALLEMPQQGVHRGRPGPVGGRTVPFTNIAPPALPPSNGCSIASACHGHIQRATGTTWSRPARADLHQRASFKDEPRVARPQSAHRDLPAHVALRHERRSAEQSAESLGLFAGVLVDRMRRRPPLITADIGRDKRPAV